MSNIRYGLLIKEPPPIVLKQSSAHFDMQSDFTGDGSQNKEASAHFPGELLMYAGAKKRFVATAGLEIKSNMVGYPQINNSAVYASTGANGIGIPRIGEYGQVNPTNADGCTFFFPFNRWNMVGHGTLTPSTEISAYPATNTYLQQRSKVWRSTSTTASLTRDLANPYRISAVCIVSHNLTKDGTFRVRVGNDSTFTTNKYDSGTLPIWEPSFATSGLYAEEADSGGYPTNELIELLRYCGENPRVVRWVTFTEVNARHIKIDFTDTSNAYSLIEIAYIYVGVHVLVSPSQLYGWTLHPVGVSRVKKSASGSPWIDVMYRAMNASVNLPAQPEAQTLAFLNLIAGYLGRRKEFIVAFQPSNLPKKFWFTSYCRFEQTPQLTAIASGVYNEELNFEELVG